MLSRVWGSKLGITVWVLGLRGFGFRALGLRVYCLVVRVEGLSVLG